MNNADLMKLYKELDELKRSPPSEERNLRIRIVSNLINTRYGKLGELPPWAGEGEV